MRITTYCKFYIKTVGFKSNQALIIEFDSKKVHADLIVFEKHAEFSDDSAAVVSFPVNKKDRKRIRKSKSLND